MSKSATASSSKLPSQLPSKSAWARGPPTAAPSPKNATPNASSRPSSPAPSQTPPASVSHSRRPSTLGPGVPIKDGVSIPQRAASSVKQGSSVTFGSIDDVSAPISSSPASVPTLKSQGVKTFGTVPATQAAPAQPNGTSSSPAPPATKPAVAPAATPPAASAAPPKATSPAAATKPAVSRADIAKLFQSPSSSPSASADSPPATRSPAQGSAPLPPATPSTQPSPLAHTYTPFVPANAFRGVPQPQPPANGAPPGSPHIPPRSPVYPRQMSNGAPGARPPPGPGQPPMTPQQQVQGLPSPRMTPQGAHPVHTPNMPPQGLPMPPPPWPGYYYQYPGMPPPEQMYSYAPGWGMPPQMPPHQHPHHPGQPGPPGPPHITTMSPRAPPQQLAVPGTPSQVHAVPPGGPPGPGPGAHPHQHGHHAQQPPPTPTTPATPGGIARLNSQASAFVPSNRASKVVIKDPSGREFNVGDLRSKQAGAEPATPPTPVREQSKRVSVRLESEEAKRAREEKEREEKERKEREVREAREAKEREERAKKEKEEAEKRAKEEAEKRAKEEEERKIREEEERKKREEEERLRKEEEEEKERLRKEKEEEERKAREEEERKVKEETERKAREEAERKEKEEAERLAREQEERQRKEEEEKKAAAAAAAAEIGKAKVDVPAAIEEKEEGEITEDSKPKVKESLKINTTLEVPRRRPGPLDLSSAQKPNIPGGLPSALATARIIEDINQVQYPEGILSPKIELNANAKDGKFRYDREFLLQFMSVCKEKPDSLPPLDAIGLEPADQSYHSMSRGGSQRRASGALPPNAMTRQPSQGGVGLGLGMGNFGGKQGSGFAMGQFTTAKSSEERFALASGQRTPSGTGGSQFRPSPMARGGSQQDSGRRRSKRGVPRPPADKGPGPGPSGLAPGGPAAYGPDGQLLPPVKPLEKSQDAWNPLSKQRNAAQDDNDPAYVDRKVKALLNKLTMEKFDSISDQIISWANKSEEQTDGRTLIQVIRLVFEKATDEAAWSEMYARLCRKMMEQISPKVQDEGIRGPEGKPIAGGQLFRKYLLNRCQEDFERGWAQKDAAQAAAAAKSSQDEATAKANEGKEDDGEVALYSEEYYAAQKAKRQGLGLVKFIGELFKLQMLTERIMHVCVKKLVGNVENPEEEEIESLCKLLSTVGKMLDTDKASGHMDVYFQRMKEMAKNPKVNSRMVFMLQDVIELRERKWLPRNAQAVPATRAQIREQAAKDDAKEATQRSMAMSRGGSRRGGDRGDATQVGPDGWAVAGGAAPRPPPKAGDLSQFGKISKGSGSMSFGPSSVFNKKESKRESISRQPSQNMFSMLSQNPEIAAEVATAPATSGKGSRPPSRKPSVDLGSQGPPEPSGQRRRLQLLPRTMPVESVTPAPSEPGSEEEGGDDDHGAGTMSEADATKKVDEDLKEFFAIRNVDEGEEYFKIPAEHRHLLVDKLVTKAIESKEADAQLVGDLFARAVEKGLCTPEVFERGFEPIAELLDDIAIDAPKAFNLMAIMMKGAGLAADEERRTRIAGKSMDSDKLLALLA